MRHSLCFVEGEQYSSTRIGWLANWMKHSVGPFLNRALPALEMACGIGNNWFAGRRLIQGNAMFLPQKLLRSCRQLAAGAAAKEAGNSDEVSGEAGTNPQHSIVICYLMDGAARGLLCGRRRSCSSSSRGLSCSCRGQRKQERFMKDTECVAPCSADDQSSRQPTIKV